MSVDMRGEVEKLAASWLKLGHDLGFGIGIAHGYATLGRIGFEGRHDYGAIGNVTILASRLSSQAQAGQILLGPRIDAILGGSVELESVGELQLKGLSRPVEAWNVVALRPDATAAELVPETA
jgi:class 3 adenylate cyclase